MSLARSLLTVPLDFFSPDLCEPTQEGGGPGGSGGLAEPPLSRGGGLTGLAEEASVKVHRPGGAARSSSSDPGSSLTTLAAPLPLRARGEGEVLLRGEGVVDLDFFGFG